ncbi:MAG: hypothetical protein AB2610_01540 [Candidatus Thiodiazotropha sp.]
MSNPLPYNLFTELNNKIGDTPADKITVTEINRDSEQFTYKYLKSLVEGKTKLVLITIAE